MDPTREFSLSNYTLCKDGYFRLAVNEEDIYYVNSRQWGQIVYNYCQEKINKVVQSAGYNENDIRIPTINIELHRSNAKPSHLFNEEEIRQLMKKADDRNHNILVIDEDGYAQIVNTPSQALWYPTRQEAWCAGNVYVGKYSNLSDASRAYHVSLAGWLSYLKTGARSYGNEWISYTSEEKEQCILEIKRYMKS